MKEKAGTCLKRAGSDACDLFQAITDDRKGIR
jgi:hypothetical protein